MDPVFDADVVGDLLSRDRRGPEPAIYREGSDRTHSYHDLITTVYKACNVLRYLGVSGSSRVAIAADPSIKPISAMLGSALLGAPVSFFDLPVPITESPPQSSLSTEVDSPLFSNERCEPPAAVITPADIETAFDLQPGTKLAVYGQEPDDPRSIHWEAAVWGENPTVPPYAVDPGDDFLHTDRGALTHETILEGASTARDAMNLTPDDLVAVDDTVFEPTVLTAGFIAPLITGASVSLPATQAASTNPHPETTIVVGRADAAADESSAPLTRFESIDRHFDCRQISLETVAGTR